MASASGTTGASNEAAIWTAIRATLLTAGWTETPLIATAGARSSAFQGIALDQVANNKPTIVVTEVLASHVIWFNTGTDWDTSLKVLINKAGDTGSTLGTDATQNTYRARANNYALFVWNLTNAGFPYKAYVGWWRRGLYRTHSGITTAMGVGTIGQTSTPVSSDMTGRLFVGQKIHRLNFGHANGSANAGNCEVITLTSITGGGSPAVGHTALTKAYDTGALLGERPMNCGVAANFFADWGNAQSAINNAGGRAGSTGSTAFYNGSVDGPSSMKPDAGSGKYPTGRGLMTWNSDSPSAANGFFGKPFHMLWSYFGSGAYNDISDDGLRQYATVGVTTGVLVALATDASTTATRYLNASPGMLNFDQEDEGAPPGVPATMAAPSASAGNAQAVVTWAAATSDWPNPVTGYVVTPYPDGTPVTVGNVLTATVTGLTNLRKYSFTVHAINAIGAGNESPESTGVTPSATATAPGVPTSVVATPFGTSGVITWKPPVSDGGSAIIDYTVDGLPGGPFSTSGSTSYIATGLTPGTTYSVTVAAVNSIGTGSTTGVSLAIASTAPSVPQSLAMTLVTAVSATFNWAAPATNGGAALTGYVISGHPAGPTTVGPGVTSLALTGLLAGTAYTMVVVATNSVGSSVAASTGFSTNQTLPTAPQSFVATKKGSTEGLLQWEDPADGGGTGLIFYRIAGLPGGAFDILGTENSYLATGLTPGATYNVTVCAVNHTGAGATASASFTTDATAPSVPLSFTVSNITPHTADLAWSTPSTNGGSAITGYTTVRTGGGSSSVGAGIHATTAAFLSPGTIYTYSVYASNAIGDGPAASVTFITTASSPVVAVVSPTAGTAIESHTPLIVDVTDAQGLERVVLLMSFADLAQAELVHDGNRFTRPYQAGSTMAVIFGGGFRFTLQRQGGWPAPPTLEIVAYDIAGKEV